jgi:mutator protein MutT
MMKISKTLISTLQQLMDGGLVAASTLRKDIAETLLAEGLLTVQTHGSRRAFRAIDAIALKNFLQTHYEELRTLGDNYLDSYTTRFEQAAETGNSKLVMVRSCPGFPVNSYEPITCSLSGNEIVVNPPEGGFVFIDNWQQFTIPNDVVVVGIENMENFRMIRHQRKLFESVLGDTPLLFVSRYPQSKDLRKWLQGITNRYVHFGDFDLAGINIFLTEFQQFLGARSSFFIPSDIEKRLQIGSQDRYNNQLSRFRDLKCDENRIQAIIDLINKYHKCYDQEGYIMKQIEVVAAVILHEGRIFATQRGYGEWKDWWEFPGGKMESGETPEEALKREIREELATDIGVDDLIETIEWDYPKFHLTMHCYWCHVEKGSLSLQEHEAAKWLGKDELLSVKWLPADIQLIDKIRDRLSE